MKHTLLTIATFVFFFLIFFSLWGFYAAIRPSRFLSLTTPKNYGLNYEEVNFTTQDGISLQGWFIPSAKPRAKTIILLHGYPADKGDILPARIFLHPDYNLFFFDFRYLGKSGGRYTTIGKNEVLDLLAAIKYLQTRGINEVGVWGFSLGGAVALMTAAESAMIKVVIAESSYASLDQMAAGYYPIPLLRYPLAALTRFWAYLFLGFDINKVSPVSAAEKVHIPVLLIHAKNDQVIAFDHALQLQKAFAKNPKLEVIFIDENISHGQSFRDNEKLIKQFLNKNF